MLRGLFNKPTKEWLEGNCNKNSVYGCWGIPWGIVFPMGIWHLWLQRNTCVIRTSEADSKAIEKCRLTAVEFFAIGMKTKPDISKTLMLVAWKKPPMGWTNLNTNGSALGCPGKANGGGLIRDHNVD